MHFSYWFSRKNNPEEFFLYEKGQSSCYATLILQGRTIVEVSDESLIFEAGPFILFGESVLNSEFTLFKGGQPVVIPF